MDEIIRSIMRATQQGDPEAWMKIEAALRRQLVDIGGCEVWILRYTHKHGDDLGVYQTSEDAYASAMQIMRQYWTEEVGNIPMPENPADAMAQYNDATNEYLEITDTKIVPTPYS